LKTLFVDQNRSPRTYFDEICELLPLMASTTTFVELLHLLLDLPVVAAALERRQQSGRARKTSQRGGKAFGEADVVTSGGTSSSHASSLPDDDDASPADDSESNRVLYNFLLRAEAGEHWHTLLCWFCV
jgi:hypothetical protein